ncbi:MAG: hypothetical protein MRJ92_06290 [Nitrospira sp.]|nr:hypothetical protein [Nitrospira sp.]
MQISKEHRECDFSFDLGDIARSGERVRQGRGLGAVFRTIPTEILPLEKLDAPILRRLCDREKVLILVTGPTGSSKSLSPLPA